MIQMERKRERDRKTWIYTEAVRKTEIKREKLIERTRMDICLWKCVCVCGGGIFPAGTLPGRALGG